MRYTRRLRSLSEFSSLIFILLFFVGGLALAAGKIIKQNSDSSFSSEFSDGTASSNAQGPLLSSHQE